MKKVVRFALVLIAVLLIFQGGFLFVSHAEDGFVEPIEAPVASERHHIAWTFRGYAAPDFQSEARGVFFPQSINILQRNGDGWAQFSSHRGPLWVYLNANRRYIPEPARLYDSRNGTFVARLTPQVVRILADEGNWIQISTWSGPRWLRWPAQGQHHIPWQFATYLEPNFRAEVQETLNPQRVDILQRREDGWAQVVTPSGNRWVHLEENRRYVARPSPLFERIGGPPSGTLSPQVVRVLDQDGDWIQISTWAGPRWLRLQPPPPVRQPGDRWVALTFDDGPGIHTARLLDALAARNVPATFYVLGQQVEARPDLAARIVAEGHEIASHGHTHRNLAGMSAAGVRTELTRTNQAIQRATGTTPTTFRPPFGSHNATTRAVAAEFGFPVILWSVDTRDWQSRNVNAILGHFVDGSGRVRIRDGDIVLLHDIHPTSVTAAIRAVDILLAEGFTFVTVTDLLEDRHGPLVPGRVYTR